MDNKTAIQPRHLLGNIVGRFIATLFFGFFFAIGAFFIVMVVREAMEGFQVRSWPTVEARIVESRVTESEGGGSPFRVEAEFEYEVDGVTYATNSVHQGGKTYDKYRKAAQAAEALAEGVRVPAHVNPDRPEQAYLKPKNIWILAVIPLPLVFAAIGAIGIWAAWFGKLTDKKKGGSKSRQLGSLSKRARGNKGCGVVFFGFFALIGGILLYLFLIRPVYKIVAAQDWIEVPCVVESSEVQSHRSDDGTTYSVDILYRYEWEGREYKSNDYDFIGGSSSGYDGKREIVRNHPPGKETVCYVNPADPSEAVLHRGFRLVLWFGLLPLAFFLIGVVGVFLVLKKAKGSGRTALSGIPGHTTMQSKSSTGVAAAPLEATVDGEAERELKPRHSPMMKLFSVLLVAGIWNGITGIFVYEAVSKFLRGRADWFLTLFLIPFVAIGLLLIGLSIYQLLALRNPRPRLKIRPGSPRSGGEFDVSWQMDGKVDRMKRFVIELIGREWVRYTRGTRTVTDTSVFARIPLVEDTSPHNISRGGTIAGLPPGLLPSMEARHNKIEWYLHVHGDVPRWPDVDDEFLITLRGEPRSDQSAMEEPQPASKPLDSSSGYGLNIALKDGREHYRPGDLLRGTASWKLDEEPENISVKLIWHTEGKGTSDVQLISSQVCHQLTSVGSMDFEFTLPDGPCSFDGQLISLIWAVELVVDPGDRAAHQVFILSPSGKPYQLGALPKDKKNRPFLHFGR